VGIGDYTLGPYPLVRPSISAIASSVLLPLSCIARVPWLGGLAKAPGYQSPRHARLFVKVCRSQLEVFDAGLAGYYVHAFRKPA
jgi:hypothetical protein